MKHIFSLLLLGCSLFGATAAAQSRPAKKKAVIAKDYSLINQTNKAMSKIEMPVLPYAPNALEPVISQATIEFHYGKHLQAYVNNLIQLTAGTEFEGKSLEEIVKTCPEGPIFNNAGQALNHKIYFLHFQAPTEGNAPAGRIAAAIDASFGSFDNFKKEFEQAGATLFGSGWAWLSQDESGKLVITKEINGSNPVRHGLNPIFGIDVWEHAYYLDYQNRRADHLSAIWSIVNWAAVEANMK